jgi:hypothetical protein
MVPDDTRLVPEDKGISTTNWNNNNIAENLQVPAVQLEDRKKSKKINKEKKKGNVRRINTMVARKSIVNDQNVI